MQGRGDIFLNDLVGLQQVFNISYEELSKIYRTHAILNNHQKNSTLSVGKVLFWFVTALASILYSAPDRLAITRGFYPRSALPSDRRSYPAVEHFGLDGTPLISGGR